MAEADLHQHALVEEHLAQVPHLGGQVVAQAGQLLDRDAFSHAELRRNDVFGRRALATGRKRVGRALAHGRHFDRPGGEGGQQRGQGESESGHASFRSRVLWTAWRGIENPTESQTAYRSGREEVITA